MGAILWYEPMQRTLQNATIAAGNGVTLDLLGRYTTVSLQVAGTVADVTIHFEGSIDGANWVSVAGYGVTAGNGVVVAAGAEGVFSIPVAGLNYFRGRRSGVGVGAVTVTAVATGAPGMQVVI